MKIRFQILIFWMWKMCLVIVGVLWEVKFFTIFIVFKTINETIPIKFVSSLFWKNGDIFEQFQKLGEKIYKNETFQNFIQYVFFPYYPEILGKVHLKIFLIFLLISKLVFSSTVISHFYKLFSSTNFWNILISSRNFFE